MPITTDALKGNFMIDLQVIQKRGCWLGTPVPCYADPALALLKSSLTPHILLLGARVSNSLSQKSILLASTTRVTLVATVGRPTLLILSQERVPF